jgi:ribosome-binding protein aMBF1 (putative translation factor)
LEFAVQVTERMAELGISITDLAKKVKVDESLLTQFLTGDPNASARARTHDLTQSL